MKFILIGVVGLTAVVLLEALVYTMRYLSDRRKDELKRPVPGLPEGGMRARFGVFIQLRDGKIAAQRNYDCFDPW